MWIWIGIACIAVPSVGLALVLCGMAHIADDRMAEMWRERK